MYYFAVLLTILRYVTCVRAYCEKINTPLEVGAWKAHYKNLDSAVIQSHPVSSAEGQVYVYENDFPGHAIKYIHVDNVAVKTCGATAAIKSGGLDQSSVFLVLHAGTNQEIRSVVDIWGVKNPGPFMITQKPKIHFMRSLYLSKDLDTI